MHPTGAEVEAVPFLVPLWVTRAKLTPAVKVVPTETGLNRLGLAILANPPLEQFLVAILINSVTYGRRDLSDLTVLHSGVRAEYGVS